MSYLITILVFIVVFSLLILIHELGHFWAAKSSGIKVEEFGLGLPPRAWGKKKGETIYSLNWVPFGGFVRMLGEDATETKALKQKRSFIAQPVRTRIKVVVAGVVMNFLLAWLLLTIGFSVGMQPIFLPGDVLPAVQNGQIILEEGEVEGAEVVTFPRVKVFEVDQSSDSYRYGLRPGDIVVNVNGREIFTLTDYEEAIKGASTLEYTISRNGERQNLIVELDHGGEVIVSSVMEGSPAAETGLREGDLIEALNGEKIENPELVVKRIAEFVESNPGEALALTIVREGERSLYEITPEDGRIGVLLSELADYGSGEGVSLYNSDVVSSLVEIKDEKYPVYIAPFKALRESGRLAKVTAVMFVDFVKGLVSHGEVPETVAGPVRIAQFTYVFVQEGVIPLLRFVALLSLSLAVINILPFPALDGGRLLFILIEAVSGKKVNQKVEAIIHTVGYGLILLLIVAVTYHDILSVFF